MEDGLIIEEHTKFTKEKFTQKNGKNIKGRDKMFGIDPRSSKTKEAVKLANLLPHGSGIDGDWLIEKKGNKLYAYNSYHVMNEYGFYVGWQDFYAVFPINNFSKFKLHFQGNQYLAQRYDLRGYLEDLIASCIIGW